jgi:hypothetical protein
MVGAAVIFRERLVWDGDFSESPQGQSSQVGYMQQRLGAGVLVRKHRVAFSQCARVPVEGLAQFGEYAVSVVRIFETTGCVS